MFYFFLLTWRHNREPGFSPNTQHLLIASLKIKFQDQLRNEYSLEEIHSFFFLLTQSILGKSRLDLALNPSYEVSSEQEMLLENALHRLQDHQPIQYILGQTEFYGLEFRVNNHVLIPRPETEELVQWIIDDHKRERGSCPLRILDIGTGSGCIAISLAKHLSQSEVVALDISAEALDVARENAKLNLVEIAFIRGDILQKEFLPDTYTIMVSNPPYVRELEMKQMQRNVLEHEPGTALYVKDDDPLIFYRKIAKLAEHALDTDGVVYFEINQYLGKETAQVLEDRGFETELRKDIYGNFRMLKAWRNHKK